VYKFQALPFFMVRPATSTWVQPTQEIPLERYLEFRIPLLRTCTTSGMPFMKEWWRSV